MGGRTEISSSQRYMLLEYFRSGMQSCSKETLPKREAAASQTGLSMKSVNVSLRFVVSW